MRKLLLAAVACSVVACAQKDAVRAPGVAGSFYPADAKELARMVDGFLAKATPAPEPKLVAIVSPHAGYEFSGHVAAWSYALVKGRKYKRVVVIAPSHVEAFDFASVYDGAAYETPLGRIAVDREFARKLVAASGGGGAIQFSSRGHKVGAGRAEHALEDQLPFLQRALAGEFQLVPIVMGSQEYENCRALGLALARLLKGTSDTLIVASSDLSHFHPYDVAVKIDHKTLKAVEEWDYLSMSRNFAQNIWEACGGGPIIAAMIASERLGANRAKILKYANSGDVTSERSRVVGYGAVAFVAESKQTGEAAAFTLAAADRAELLRIARASVERAVREHKPYEFDLPASESLSQERGAFVTLKKHGELRGCIGYVAPMEPLAYTVRDVAAFAALRDHRFPPVSKDELGELEYEISVLSPLRRVLDVGGIVTGRDGLLMRRGDSEGLLLPQVATEQGWDRPTFLRETCLKAGLREDAWRDAATDIFSFTAVVFGENRK